METTRSPIDESCLFVTVNQNIFPLVDNLHKHVKSSGIAFRMYTGRAFFLSFNEHSGRHVADLKQSRTGVKATLKLRGLSEKDFVGLEWKLQSNGGYVDICLTEANVARIGDFIIRLLGGKVQTVEPAFVPEI